METPKIGTSVSQALGAVLRRLTIRQIAHRSFVAMIVFASLYAVLLLVGRLTGTYAEVFSPWSVAIVPVLSLIAGIVWPGRPAQKAAAHAMDEYHKTKDLFLTALMLEQSPCEYSPLVLRDAEKAAKNVKPEQVVPFQWEHPSLVSAATLGVLLLGAFFIPTLDPFGNVAEAKQSETQRRLLEETKKKTEERKKQLARKELEEENSEEVNSAVEKLQASFQQTKKGDRKKNLLELNKRQKEIGEMFRNLQSGELKSLFDEAKSNQKLGAINDQEMFRKWQKELQEGGSKSLQSKMEQMKDDLERLMKEKDPVKRSEMEREIKKQLKELHDFASTKTGSEALKAALQRAMDQMDAAKSDELSKEAMEALKESMELAQQEVQGLAQAARDLEKLEDALEMISMAKKMNAEDQLDGEMFPGEMTLEDYAEMYAQLMGQQGDGEGTGGQGQGDSESVDEDDSTETDFIDEKSKSAVQKGKILLSMKTKGLSDSGDIKDADYKRIVGEINQSLDEVIDQEQIPPGYVDGIKKYFDTLEKTEPK